jgi:hypothetical protein
MNLCPKTLLPFRWIDGTPTEEERPKREKKGIPDRSALSSF